MSEQEGGRGGDPVQTAIRAEHRQLASLFAETRAALEKEKDGPKARASFAQLQDGMEAHFQREESLYYPTIWTLRPDLKDSLNGLVETHPQFRDRLAAIAGELEAAAYAEAGSNLEEFADLFSDHERAEELLLQSLDAELTGEA
ncbi:MAG: hemerythrin domain-containing protein [Planctomycetota bacterium]